MNRRIRLTVIGAGRVGRALGRLARQGGYSIRDVVCRSQQNATRAVRFIGAGNPQAASRAKLKAADVFLIATPDDLIETAARTVATARIETLGVGLRRPAVLHTSGALSSNVLSPLRNHGFAVGSCHPLQSVESAVRGARLLADAFFCVEGDPRAVRSARLLVRAIGARSFQLDPGSKGIYHASAVFASGGVTALISISLELLSLAGVPESKARQALLPLIEGTVDNIKLRGPARALTGPVRRGDAGTVLINIRALANLRPEWLDLYRFLALRGVSLAEQAGIEESSLAEVRRVIQNIGKFA